MSDNLSEKVTAERILKPNVRINNQQLNYSEAIGYINKIKEKQEALKKLKIVDNKYLEMYVTI